MEPKWQPASQLLLGGSITLSISAKLSVVCNMSLCKFITKASLGQWLCVG